MGSPSLSFSQFVEHLLPPSRLESLNSAMGWASLSDAERVRFFEEEDAPPLSLLQLTATPGVWKSHYSLTSQVLTLPEMEDAITRVQRWEDFMIDPQWADQS